MSKLGKALLFAEGFREWVKKAIELDLPEAEARKYEAKAREWDREAEREASEVLAGWSKGYKLSVQ